MKRYRMILDSNYNGHTAAFMYDADDFRLTSDERVWRERRERDLTDLGDVVEYVGRDKLATLADGTVYRIFSDRSAKLLTPAEADAHRADAEAERVARKAARDAYAAARR